MISIQCQTLKGVLRDGYAWRHLVLARQRPGRVEQMMFSKKHDHERVFLLSLRLS